MSAIEPVIKAQYAKFFYTSDWYAFKEIAEYYLESAARLKSRDIQFASSQRLVRNIQKRLFIGIGCELLIKSIYLKKGFCINKPKPRAVIPGRPPYLIDHIDPSYFEDDDTYSMTTIIDLLSRVHSFSDHAMVNKGLRIAKVFRNKEGHIAVYKHQPDPSNYEDIENALVSVYQEIFGQKLKIQISFEGNEPSEFKIS